MTSLHWQTITPEMRQVMAAFAQSEIGGRFYLAGGTALALSWGTAARWTWTTSRRLKTSLC